MNSVSLIFCIICFLFHRVQSQECRYDSYKKYMLEATQNFKAKRYGKAKEYFNLAFASVNVPLGMDLENVLNLYQKKNDEEMMHSVAILMAKGGTPKEYFQRYHRLSWFPQFQQKFSQYDSIYKSNFNVEYRRRITELIAYDIDFNTKYHDWRSGKIDMSLDKMISEAKYIATELEVLINEYGLPLENKIGYYYDYRKRRIKKLPIESLIIHIHQRGKSLIKSDQIVVLICYGLLNEEYKDLLPRIKGFSDEESIEKEMTLRYSMFGGK